MKSPMKATKTLARPAEKARMPKRRRSIIGAAVRRSTTRKASPSAPARRSSPTVPGLVQPHAPPWLRASRRARRPAEARAAPGTSNDSRRPGRSAGRIRAAQAMATSPTGTLTRKIARHVASSVRRPPSAGPRVRPIETLMALRPSARPRSPGPNVRATMAGPIAMSIAAPTPWSARNPMRAPMPGARPHRTLAAVKIANPAR